MKTLKIFNSTKLALVDDEDYDSIVKCNWGAYGTHTERICSTVRGIDGKSQTLSNFVMKTEGVLYDHKDRNPFNNQKNNLRVTTNQLNQANRSKDEFFKDPTSKYKGVSWHKATKRWRAYITVNDKHISLGYYHSETFAARAYDTAAVKFFKEFACLNLPEEIA